MIVPFKCAFCWGISSYRSCLMTPKGNNQEYSMLEKGKQPQKFNQEAKRNINSHRRFQASHCCKRHDRITPGTIGFLNFLGIAPALESVECPGITGTRHIVRSFGRSACGGDLFLMRHVSGDPIQQASKPRNFRLLRTSYFLLDHVGSIKGPHDPKPKKC